MNQLIREQKINKDKLNNEQYFQSIMEEICNQHLIEDDRMEQIQYELAILLTKEVERYTGGESSSIRIEKATQIFQSISYNIGIYLKSFDDIYKKLELLNNENISTLFLAGMDLISSEYKQTKSVLEQIQSEILSIDNIAYQDTIGEGLMEFFHDYEYEFSSHETEGSIDYPLCIEVVNKTGIEFMKEFIDKLKLENDFCRQFAEDKIELLLMGYHKDYRDFLINLYTIILTNALGCRMIGQNILSLNIGKEELYLLQKQLKGLNKEELLHHLNIAFEEICMELRLDNNQVEYGKLAILQIGPRLEYNLNTDTLDQLFIAFPEQNWEHSMLYEDGMQMSDERLRELIEEIREYERLGDKLNLLKNEVHSMADLMEVMEECFYGDELYEVFSLLSTDEITMLKKKIEEEAELENIKYECELKEWQLLLSRYQNINNE